MYKTRPILIAFFTVFFFLEAVHPVFAAGEISGQVNRDSPAIGAVFSGEEFTYSVGFWLFEGVAIGKINIRKEGSTYVSTLRAYTTGIASWLRHREDTYISRIEEVEGGRRFRTLSFDENTIVGSREKRVLTEFDYDRGTMRVKKWKNRQLRSEVELTIAPGVFYDDPLVAFYNFRYGVYGQVEEGRRYSIKTFPKGADKEVDIKLRIVNKEEFKNRNGENDGYIADVKLDKELFGSASGEVEVVFDRNLVPLNAVAKDIMFFGDVRGKLVEEAKEGH